MPTTLSPFRYLQVAQYLVRKWTDQVPRGTIGVWKGKGKGRAEPLVLSPPRLDGVVRSNTSQASSTPSETSQELSSESIAGPSRHNGTPTGGQQTQRKAGVGPDPKDPHMPVEQAKIYALMNDARLSNPKSVKPPREIVVLCHGELDAGNLSEQIADQSRIVWVLYVDSNTALPFSQTALLGLGLGYSERSDGM